MVATTVDVVVNARWKGDSVNRGTKQVNRDMDRLKSTLQRMAPILRTIGALMGVAVGVQAVRQVVGMADAWKGYQNRIKLFTNSAEEAAAVQERLFGISQRTRTAMGSTVELYQRFSIANKELGLSQAELGGVLETVNQALIISGGSSESANAAVIQLGQGLASGVLRGEELNSVMEQAPRLAMAFATGLGVPIGKLRELGAEGKITALQIIEALQSQAPVVAAEYGKMEITVDGAWTKLTDAVGLYVSKFDEAIGLTSALAGAMSEVADSVAAAASAEPRYGRTGGRRRETWTGNAPGESGMGSKKSGLPALDYLLYADLSPDDLARALELAQGRLGETGFGGGPGRRGRGRQQKQLDANARERSVALQTAITAETLPPVPISFPGGDPFGLSSEEMKKFRSIGGGGGPGAGASFGRFAGGGGGMSSELLRGRVAGEGLAGGSGFQQAAVLPVGGLDQTIGGGRGTPQQLAILQRGEEARATSERELLKIRQKFEVANAKLVDNGEVYLDTLNDVHKAELKGFDIKKEAKKLAADDLKNDRELAKANRDLDRLLLQKARDDHRTYMNGIQAVGMVVTAVNPELGVFVNAFQQMAQGNILGGVVTGLLGMASAMGLLGDSSISAAQRTRELEAAQRKHLETLQQIAIAEGGAGAAEVRTLQMEAVQPLLDMFRDMQTTGGSGFVDTLERLIKLSRSAAITPDYGTFIENLTEADILSLGPDFKRNPARTQMLIDLQSMEAAIDIAFGSGTTLEDAIRNMFTVEDAFEGLADSAALAEAALKPLQRAVTTTFDVEEMKLRRSASAQFGAAGGDIHEQARVFAQLKTSIDDLAVRERTALQNLSATPGTAPGAGTGAGTAPVAPAPVSGSDAVVLESAPLADYGVFSYDDIIDFTGSITKIDKPWAHAVRFRPSNLVMGFGVSHFNRVVEWSGSVTKIDRPWAHAVRFNASNLVDAEGFGVSRYAQIVEFGGSVTKIDKPWAHAVQFRKSNLTTPGMYEGFGVSRYAQIVEFGGSPVTKINKPWAHAVGFTSSLLVEGFGVSHYEQIVAFGESPVTKIDKPWAHAVRFTPSNLVEGFGMTHYNKVIEYSGTATKIPVPWGHAVDFTDKIQIVHFGQIFDIMAQPIDVNINEIIRVVGSPRKLSVADIVDLSELEGIVGGIVARASRNRSTGDTREEARSRTRQSGKEGSDYYKNTGSGMGW